VWLDVGDQEGRRTLADAEHLNRRLKANGWKPGRRFILSGWRAGRTMRRVGRGG
jgi:hypothetical protein